MKLMKDIFQNPLSAKNFFFRTDFDVLIEVLLRNLTDLPDGMVRRDNPLVLAHRCYRNAWLRWMYSQKP